MAFRRCLAYLFLTSVAVALCFFFLINQYFSEHPRVNEITLIAGSIYMWIPGIFALIYMKKEKISFKIWKKPSAFFWHALWVPALICFLGIGFNFLFASFSLDAVNIALENQRILFFSSPVLNIGVFLLYLFVVAALASLTFNFLFALGEELFWRGYLWEKLKCLGFYRASFWIGAIWGLWHAPVILLLGYNYPEHRVLGAVFMVIFCILLSPLYTYFRIQDKSLQAPTILHGMMNAFLPLAIAIFPEGEAMLLAPLGIGGFLALLVANLYFFHPKRKEELQIARLLLYS